MRPGNLRLKKILLIHSRPSARGEPARRRPRRSSAPACCSGTAAIASAAERLGSHGDGGAGAPVLPVGRRSVLAGDVAQALDELGLLAEGGSNLDQLAGTGAEFAGAVLAVGPGAQPQRSCWRSPRRWTSSGCSRCVRAGPRRRPRPGSAQWSGSPTLTVAAALTLPAVASWRPREQALVAGRRQPRELGKSLWYPGAIGQVTWADRSPTFRQPHLGPGRNVKGPRIAARPFGFPWSQGGSNP